LNSATEAEADERACRASLFHRHLLRERLGAICLDPIPLRHRDLGLVVLVDVGSLLCTLPLL
jgi:hypothetical protein